MKSVGTLQKHIHKQHNSPYKNIFRFMYNLDELSEKVDSELHAIAEGMGLKKMSSLPKNEVIDAILDQQAIDFAAMAAANMSNDKRRQPRRKKNDAAVSGNGDNQSPSDDQQDGQGAKKRGRKPQQKRSDDSIASVEPEAQPQAENAAAATEASAENPAPEKKRRGRPKGSRQKTEGESELKKSVEASEQSVDEAATVVKAEELSLIHI